MITNPNAKNLLRDIAHGKASIAHKTFTGHPQPTKVAFLRELFIEHELLEPVHLEIEKFETWLQKKLLDTTPEQSRLIRQYARWVHINRMQHLAQTGQLRKGTLLAARQSTSVALDFLRFLDEQNVDSAQCSQADIDRWLSTGPTSRSLARGFVRWASQHGHIPRVDFPYRLAKTAPIISQSQRIELLRRTLDPDAQLTLSDRTAALLLLLFGQPPHPNRNNATQPDRAKYGLAHHPHHRRRPGRPGAVREHRPSTPG